MKKNFKRWLAFLLAVVLVATSGMFRSESFLQATDDQATGSPVAGEETQLSLNNITQDEITLPPTDTAENPVTEVPPVTTENPVTDVPAVTTEEQEPATENPVTEVPPVTTEEPSTETESTEASQEENPVVQPDADVPPVNEAATVGAANAAGPGDVVESTEEPESDPDEDDLEDQEPVGLSDEVPENVMVTVECKDELGNAATESATLAFGVISADPCNKGTAYTYVGTMYQNVRISAITYGGQNADGQHIYLVTPESDADVSLEVVNPAEIKVVYSNQREVTVSYVYEESMAEVLKTEKVMTGDPFSFSVQPKMGHQITGVTVTCDGQLVDVTKDGTVYSVDGASVKGEMQVTVTAKIRDYLITFNGCDARFTYKEGDINNYDSNKGSITKTFTGSKGVLEFEVDGGQDKSHYLSAFFVILTDDMGNSEKISLELPELGKTKSATSSIVLPGTTITLKRSGWPHEWGKHTVSIAYGSGIHANIDINANYKVLGTNELTLRECSGVEEIFIIDEKGNSEIFTTEDIENPKSFKYFNFRDNRNITVYVKAKDNYCTEGIGNIDVSLTNKGEVLKKQIESIEKSDKSGYDYKISIKKLGAINNVGLNISIAPKATDFEIHYNYAGGTDADGNVSVIGGTYTLLEGNNSFLLKEAPSREKYEFVGWQYGDKVYRQSEIYKIDQKTIDLAKIENGKYICTFVAQWREKEETASTDYQIKVSFEGVNTDPVVIRKSSEYKGTIRVNSSTIETYLRNLKANGTDEEKNKIPDNWETEYEIGRTLYTLNLNTDREIHVQFKQKAYPYKVVYEYYDQNGNIEKSETKREEDLKAGTTITESPVLAENYYVESAVAVDPAGVQVQENGFDKFSYAFAGTMISGGLTITYKFRQKTELHVTVNSDTFTYDGTSHIVEGFKEESVDPVTDEKTLSVNVNDVVYIITNLSAQKEGIYVKDSGDVTVSELAQAKVYVDGEDVTSKCRITVTPGKLTINPRNLVIYAEGEETYDGTEKVLELTSKDVSIDTPIVDGDVLSLTDAKIAETDANEDGYEKTLDASEYQASVTKDGNDITDNYTITVSGKLIIKKAEGDFRREVNIEDWVYGETPKTATIEVKDGGALYYQTYTISYKSKNDENAEFVSEVPKDAGEYIVRADWEGDRNHKPIFAENSFEITKRSVTLYAENTVNYNGKKQTFDISVENVRIADGSTDWAEGDKLESLSGVSISGTDANASGYTGVETADLAVSIKNGQKDVTSNYDITVTGKLIINKASASDSKGTVNISDWKYDGTSKVPQVTLTGAGAKDYGTPEFVYEERNKYIVWDWNAISEAPTEVGTYRVKAVWVATDNCEALESEPVKFEITKRKITITAASDTKPFDGTPLVNSNYDVTGDGVAPEQTLKVVVKGSQTSVGPLPATKNNEIDKREIKITDQNGRNVKDNYDITVKNGRLEVTDDVKDPSAIIKKTHTPKAGGYNVGDTVEFEITLVNMYENALNMRITEKENVEILDQKWWDADGALIGAHETRVLRARYTITEEDILAGTFVNEVTARYLRDTASKKEYVARDEVELAQPTATLAVTMVSNPTSGYDLDDQVTYTVTVKNTGNLTLAAGTKVTVDKGTVEGTTGSVYTITEALAPGAEASFTAVYDVAEADIRAGEIVNKATAEGQIDEKSYNNDLVKKFYPTNGVAGVSTDVTVTTAAQNPQIVLTKDIVSITAADGTGKPVDGPVDIGDTITYTIVAKNAGNIALQNVVVEDELTGNTVENGNAFRIPLGFGPNAELRLDDNDTKAQYTVTEADIVAGRVTNMATVETSEITDLSGNPVILEDDDVSGGTKEIATQQQNPSLAMVIERAPVNPDDPDSLPDDSIVGLNDEVNYIIRVTNNGNVTIENIKVTDVLTGNVDGEELEIASLAPGETVELPVTYANVTEADILAGSIVNRASAVGTNKNDADEDTNKVTANAEHTAVTDAVSTAYTVTRTLTDPQAVYRVGETIRYTITITSQANVSLNNVVVSDLLDGTDGNVTYTGMTTTAADGTTTTADTIPVNTANEVTIDSLQPGSTVTLTCEYTVVRADAGTDNAIVGTTNVKADSIWTTGNDAEEMTVAAMTSTASPAPIENMYNLTIHYVYVAGGQAAPDVVAQYLEGETFTYTTPAIDGYTPDYGTVGSGETGMLARDVEVTVVYTANVINIPTTPTTPGGTPVTPGGTPVTPVIMGEPQVAPAVADAAAAAAPAAAAVTTVAAAAPDLVDVEDDEVPLAQPEDGQITEDENGDVDLVPIEDDEVPLANTVIDEHVFCILHYLLFLLTLILAVIYAISLQKQKKRLVILQKGYDEEMRNR